MDLWDLEGGKLSRGHDGRREEENGRSMIS